MFLIGSVLVLCLLTACTAVGQPAVQPTNVTIGTIVVVPTPGMPTPRPTRTYSPEALTAIAVKEANLQAERDHDATRAAISPAPMHTGAPTYSPQPTPILPYGISTFEECGGEDSHVRGFLLGNCWHGMLNGVYSDVAAGAELVEPTPGELTLGGVYVVSPADGSVPRSLIYWTSIRAGRLEIIAVDDTRVTLRAYNGTLFVFDASTRQWVDATPGPTPVPSLPPSPMPSSLPPTP